VSPFLNEAGGHRWQRIPPTERRGRKHTSTVTVSILVDNGPNLQAIRQEDIVTFVTKDSGPGGQHRNKTESCIVMRHKPTGIEAKSAGKSQHQNRKKAFELLKLRVNSYFARIKQGEDFTDRKIQRGSGMRGDKIRTYREFDNTIINADRTKMRLSDVEKGKKDMF